MTSPAGERKRLELIRFNFGITLSKEIIDGNRIWKKESARKRKCQIWKENDRKGESETAQILVLKSMR